MSTHDHYSLLDLKFAAVTYSQLVALLSQRLDAQEKTLCVPVNLDVLRLAASDHKLHSTIQSASVVIADGMPLVWLSRFSQTPLPERLPGCELVLSLCRLAHEKGYKIFILGGAPGVAEQAKQQLEEDFPGIQIVGTEAPAAAQLTDAEESAQIVARINASEADILFVALGAPKQEYWLAAHRDELRPVCILPCGGSIDFIAGIQKKAPLWLGNLGVEWLYRLWHNPTRLYRRYILEDIPFLMKLVVSNAAR